MWLCDSLEPLTIFVLSDAKWKPNMDAKLKQLIRHLGVCVTTKKNKNVDVLSLANEVSFLKVIILLINQVCKGVRLF
jgi:hypothetical protein